MSEGMPDDKGEDCLFQLQGGTVEREAEASRLDRCPGAERAPQHRGIQGKGKSKDPQKLVSPRKKMGIWRRP